MLPWSVGGVTDLPTDAKLCKMQQNADRLVHLIGAATPNVPKQTPMPQPSKQPLNVCPVPPMHVIVTLLAGCQSAILSSNEWHNDMNPAFISTIMAPNFKEGGNATSPLHSRGSPTKGAKSEVKTYARGHHDAPSISKYGSLTPTRGATQQNVNSKIVPVSSIAPEGWGPKVGGNAMSPLHSRGSPTKGTKSEVKTYARGHHDAPSISKYGSLVQPNAQIAALR